MITENTEIRHLMPGQVNDLARILDEHNGWEKLMSCITNDSSEFGKEVYKYSTEDIRLIRQAGEHRSCTEILLSEWGTSGKKRPTIRSLHKFLLKAQLIRAASYVSEKLLNEPPTENPSEITISEMLDSEFEDSHISIRKLSTIECGNIGKSREGDSMQFTVEESCNVNEQFSQEEIENVKLVDFEIIKSSTRNFDSKMVLGSGGFGTVYFGEMNNEKVAIKKMNIYDWDTNLLKQFKNELTMLSQCRTHPNILPVVAASLNEIPCLVYEYMPNGSLDKRLSCSLKEFPPMSWQKRVFIANDVTNGIKYLHTAFEKPLVHRDIKSANILLNSEDVAKIGDFGSVRKPKGFMTSYTVVYQGTQAYTAPEAFYGEVSPQLDIFSFGVVLLELLTGLLAYSPDREGGGVLLHYIEEMAPESKSFSEYLDKKAGSWDTNVWTEIYNLYKKCTADKKKRPEILEVDSVMVSLKENVSKTIG